jgi:hypothetical protein
LHEHLLALWGVPIGEMWDLEKLADRCRATARWTFFLTSSPANVLGTSNIAADLTARGCWFPTQCYSYPLNEPSSRLAIFSNLSTQPGLGDRIGLHGDGRGGVGTLHPWGRMR